MWWRLRALAALLAARVVRPEAVVSSGAAARFPQVVTVGRGAVAARFPPVVVGWVAAAACFPRAVAVGSGVLDEAADGLADVKVVSVGDAHVARVISRLEAKSIYAGHHG